MTWEPRPLPEVTPESEPFWTATAAGKFLVGECQFCDLTYYYPRSHCPDCLSTEIDWIEIDGVGSIYTYSSTSRLDGWPDEALPVVVAYVELAEGPRVLTNVVDCDPEDVAIGMDVEVTFVDTERDVVAIPVFRPVE